MSDDLTIFELDKYTIDLAVSSIFVLCSMESGFYAWQLYMICSSAESCIFWYRSDLLK